MFSIDQWLSFLSQSPTSSSIKCLLIAINTRTLYSDPAIVEKKLMTLMGKNHGLILRGFAKKYDLDPGWNP